MAGACLLALPLVACTPEAQTWKNEVERTASPVGVMGDSDSHSYQDRIWLPEGVDAPGGPYRKQTFQWTEVLAQLRSPALDLGSWGVWGERKRWVQVKDWLGWPGRAPRKEDFEHNFALGGSRCDALTTGIYRQAPRLAALMDRNPTRWQRGVVIIRIGIIDIGLADSLDALAKDAEDAGVQARTTACLGHIREAVSLIHARHPQTRIVLVGILDNSDYPPYFERWSTGTQFRNISAGLDRFDAGLRQIAAGNPSRIAFFDDRAWFRQRFGSRQEGFKTVTVSDRLRVEHTLGAHPRHSVLPDGHAGLAWNTLWAQSMVQFINERFALNIAPISDAQVRSYLESLLPPP
jgi:hypothetical protein